MSDLEGPQKPKSNEWTELDKDPKLQLNILICLKIFILEKKFGKEFYEEYEHLSIKKVLEDPTVNVGPLIPEVGAFEKKLHSIKTVEEMIAFAKEEKIPITSDDMELLKKQAVQFMAEDID